jgi:hypothetical protein
LLLQNDGVQITYLFPETLKTLWKFTYRFTSTAFDGLLAFKTMDTFLDSSVTASLTGTVLTVNIPDDVAADASAQTAVTKVTLVRNPPVSCRQQEHVAMPSAHLQPSACKSECTPRTHTS